MPRTPADRSDRPEVRGAADPLTDRLAAMHVESALYFRLEATAPWGGRFAPFGSAKFGFVARGACWLEVRGEPRAIALRAGDCFIVSNGIEHVLRDAHRSALVPCSSLASLRDENSVVRYGGGGASTVLICGSFTFDAWSSAPLLEVLPRVLTVQTDDAQAAALRGTLDLLAIETSAASLGSPVVVSRLADILFVQAIRAHHASGRTATGWLSAVADPRIGAALRAMHRDVARPWTVESLAAAAGMSRSAFAVRFKELVGSAPLEYLTRWRMQKAGSELRTSGAGLAEIAEHVGYESVGALSRTFRRIHGVSPAELRRAARAQRTEQAT